MAEGGRPGTMRTLGVDLSADVAKTAACVVDWHAGTIAFLPRPVSDAALVGAIAVIVLDTLRALREHDHGLAAYCPKCRRWAVLDLAKLIADGHGELGIRSEKLRVHEHGPDELAHYAAAAFDIQYEFPFGWQELEGIHDRTDFDLGRHEEHSGKKLSYFDEQTKERFVPYIVETSAGVDRTLLMCLVDGFREEGEGKDARTVLRLTPRIAPIKLAVFPLVRRDGMPELAEEIHRGLGRRWNAFFDDGGSIGRRYRRQDEAGTPFCVTVDGESVTGRTVTVRDRDSMEQVRVGVDRLEDWLAERLEGRRQG